MARTPCQALRDIQQPCATAKWLLEMRGSERNNERETQGKKRIFNANNTSSESRGHSEIFASWMLWSRTLVEVLNIRTGWTWFQNCTENLLLFKSICWRYNSMFICFQENMWCQISSFTVTIFRDVFTKPGQKSPNTSLIFWSQGNGIFFPSFL